ncbi:MAG TPA: hypothetical protein VJ907_02675 [Halanaerobiales bacterium]|nr:hypothetical protein [Halanaerobiales bacterium]
MIIKQVISILIDMNNNVGTQSLTVVVRGLAISKLYLANFLSPYLERNKS